jgi:uncharacterized protein
MIVAISGSSGLIGSGLVSLLTSRGHSVRRIARHENPTAAIDGADVVVNLAGENIAQRWTARARAAIRDSRMHATSSIVEAIARAAIKPRVFLSGSAIGIYGNRGDELLDESSAQGSDFLARVCVEWEAAARPAAEAGVRVVHLRTGLVLAAHGGALAKLLLPFRLGVGGRIGNGHQWMSWITLADHVRAMEFLMSSEISGPVNLVAPNPVTNSEFVAALGRVLRRPTVFPVPALALTLALGDMARDTILASQRVVPQRLLESGFQFESPDLLGGLQRVLSSNN